jgi:NADH-quinone oxidoreductase subunit N
VISLRLICAVVDLSRVNYSDLADLAPELCIVAAIVGVLLAALALQRSKINTAAGAITLIGLIAAMFCVLRLGAQCTYWPHQTVRLAGGLLVLDPLALFWKALLLPATALAALLWFACGPRGSRSPMERSDPRPGDGAEFFTLLLGASLGLSIMASTDNLLMIFIGVELASLPSYALAGFRKASEPGAEASLKYVVFGAAATAVMAYGLSVIYALFGTLSFFEALSAAGPGGLLTGSAGPAATLALIAIAVGLAFKIAAVPVHFWCPDVFEGAGAEVAAFLSVASKGAALILLARLTTLLASTWTPSEINGGAAYWCAGLLGFIGAFSATLGNVAALAQTNVKRLLAYSSIAQAGYMLCLVALLAGGGAYGHSDGYAGAGTGAIFQALIIYLTIYLLMNMGAFAVAGMAQRASGDGSLRGLAGLGRGAPITAACMALFMLSLVGLPPLAGFNAKLYLLVALGRSGAWGWVLAAVVVVNTVVSLYYYLRVVRAMYVAPRRAGGDAIVPSVADAGGGEQSLALNPVGVGISVVCAVLLLVLFVAAWMPERLAPAQRSWMSVPAAPITASAIP